MIEGLWIVQYEGLQGEGVGVVVFVNGRVLGGDFGYTYEGTYVVNNDILEAHVHIANFMPAMASVLGYVGDFDIKMQVAIGNGVIQGAMSIIDNPELSIAVRLTKKAHL